MLEKAIAAQIKRLECGEKIEQKHLDWLQRKLSRVKKLIAFDRLMEESMDSGADCVMKVYLASLQPVILQLAYVYQKRENLQAGYFAYFVSRHPLKRHMSTDAVQTVMVEYMERDNLYCRANALEALYSFGTEENIVKALLIQDKRNVFFHGNILLEGLLGYTGDHRRLIALLWERKDDFSAGTRSAILNYTRFKLSGGERKNE